VAKNIAMVIANNFEDAEATSPKEYLEGKGAKVTVIGIDKNTVHGKKGATLDPDMTFDQLGADGIDQFDALVIPGGGAPENLRINDAAVEFTKRFVDSGKVVASICHGPQLLISAGVLKNRTTTSVNKIRDDVRNAGAHYVDEPVAVDGNLISSRTPADLELFNDAIAAALEL
jgi:protease I